MHLNASGGKGLVAALASASMLLCALPAATAYAEPASNAGATATAADTPAVTTQLATYYGKAPNLPAEIDGKAVTWNDDYTQGDTYNDLWGTVAAEGTTADGGKATATVDVVPEGITYFVDAGTGKDWKTAASIARKDVTSGTWTAVKALAGDQLLNGTDSDQFYVAADGDTWGHEQSKRSSDNRPSPDQVSFPDTTVNDGDTVSDKYAMGMTSLDKSNFTYYFTLDAGTYTLTTGIRELYNGNHGRTISQQVTDAATGDDLLTLDDVRLSPRGGSSKAKDASPVVSSGSFTLTKTTLVKVAFPRGPDVSGQSNENGVISWLAIATGENPGPILNKSALRTSVKTAKAIQADGKTYAKHSTELLDAAVNEADKILADTDGSTYSQDEVDWQVRMVDAATETMAERDLNETRYTGVQVGKQWLDTEGAMIQAHGGGFLQQTDTDGKPIYYWVGEDKTHNSSNYNGIALYSSKDLVNWTFRHLILKYDVDTPGLNQNKIERPKLIYNAKTKKYVLWGHWEGYDGYSSSQVVVATSDTVDGDYQYLGHWRPGADSDHRNWRTERGHTFFENGDEIDSADLADTAKWGYGSRDMTLFVDDDGTAYMISAQDGSRMRIYQLNDDYTDVAFNDDGTVKMTYLMFDGGRREAPALSKVNGKYYIITSGQSGWLPNEARYSYTSDLTDPTGWKTEATGKSPFAAIGNNSTFYSQPTNIMQINGSKGTTLVYMGDRWNPSALRDSTYVWLPLTETGDADNPLTMNYSDGWSVDTETGEVKQPDIQLLSRGDGVTTSTNAAVTDKEGFELKNANDGDYTTFFRGYDADGATVTMPFTYTVDLGKISNVSRVDLSTRLVNGSETYYQYVIETSVNGVNWTKQVDHSDNTTVGFLSDQLSGQARYVRMTVTKVAKQKDNQSASWAVGVQEFEVYGTKAEGLETVTDTALTAQAFKVAGKDPVNRVQLRWKGVDAATSYVVYRSHKADMSDAEAVKTFDGTTGSATGDDSAATATSWVDNLPAANCTYYYQVKGMLGDQVASTSVVVSAKTYARLPDGMSKYDNNTGEGSTSSNDEGIVVDGVKYRYRVSGNNTDAAANGYVVLEQKSTDGGKTWVDSDIVVAPSDATDGTFDDYKFESVSTVYNKAKNKVVIWAHYEKRSGYATGALFEADVTPGQAATTKHYGGLVYPNGYQARDKAVFVDDDGSAYLVTASNQAGETANRHIVISKLNDDWTAVEPVGENGYVAKLTASGSREAPALIKSNGWYYLFTSANAGWLPSAGGYYSAKSLDGTWSELRQVGEGSSFSTQQNGAGTWVDADGNAVSATVSGNRWWRSDGTAGWRITPLQLSEGYATSEYYRTLYTNATTGEVIPERDGTVLSEGKSATLNGADASASVDGDYTTAAANTDADLTKRWPATWQVDLGKEYPLSGLEISSYIMNGSEGWYPYTVYGSTDGENFTEILDRTAKPDAANKADFGFTAETLSGTYRYVRVIFQAPYTQNNWTKGQQTWYRAQFAEIKVLGDDGLTVPEAGDKAPELTGTDDVTVPFGGEFDPLAGVKATDDVDGDLTGDITVTITDGSGNVLDAIDTTKPGVYTVVYAVADKAGHETTATRTVTVEAEPEPEPTEYTVAFDSNGGSALKPVTVKAGKPVAKPADPTRDGYRLTGWTTDKEGKFAYDFSQPVNADLTLYAQWEKTASDGGNGGSGQPDGSDNGSGDGSDANGSGKTDADKTGKVESLTNTGSEVVVTAILAATLLAAGCAIMTQVLRRRR